MTKTLLVGALVVAAACTGARETTPAPAPAPAAAPVQQQPLPLDGWEAAFEYLVKVSGAGEGPAICLMLHGANATEAADSAVIASLRAPVPLYDARRCNLDVLPARAPDGRDAYSLHMWTAEREPGRWGVDIGYMAGPLWGTTWACTLSRPAGEWAVSDCRITFTS